jgi:hypothetical protein
MARILPVRNAHFVQRRRCGNFGALPCARCGCTSALPLTVRLLCQAPQRFGADATTLRFIFVERHTGRAGNVHLGVSLHVSLPHGQSAQWVCGGIYVPSLSNTRHWRDSSTSTVSMRKQEPLHLAIQRDFFACGLFCCAGQKYWHKTRTCKLFTCSDFFKWPCGGQWPMGASNGCKSCCTREEDADGTRASECAR